MSLCSCMDKLRFNRVRVRIGVTHLVVIDMVRVRF